MDKTIIEMRGGKQMKNQDYINEGMIMQEEPLYEMANIKRQRSGLSAEIWVDSGSTSRSVPHDEARVNLHKPDYNIEISIEAEPKILAKPEGLSISRAKREFKDAIDYVGKYFEIFKRHYDGIYDDADLFDELRKVKAIK